MAPSFDGTLRGMEILISFSPGTLKLFEKLSPTYYVARDAELFASADPEAERVGFIKVGDTTAVLQHSISNFVRVQLRRADGLVGWTHTYTPKGQRVLVLHDPGTKLVAETPIEGLGWAR